MNRELQLYQKWSEHLKGTDFEEELARIVDRPDEIYDRFYRDLSFGTAGLRGILGLGTNRMNLFTVRHATQGYARFLCETAESPSVAIAYDSRNCSQLFAREAACVFAANGVRVHLFTELMPTPTLSYAIRGLGCDGGVVVTASHNPAEYNGYKAYDNTGCQIGEEAANRILHHIDAMDLFDDIRTMPLEEALASGRVQWIADSFVEQYIDRILQESRTPDAASKAGLRLVYTPLNGAGLRCVTTVLDRIGVRDVHIVPEQKHPDGNFPTCPYPNPEAKEALELGLNLCRETGADLLVATDPDADRVGAAVLHEGEYRILTGNEVGILLLDYIASCRVRDGIMPDRPVAIKSIVSSRLTDRVASHYGIEIRNVLTGFKNIGGEILRLEQAGELSRFIYAYEESCGYLSGSYVRDKDAVDATLLLVEMASYYKLEGKTLCDVMNDIHARHGHYLDTVANFMFEGADGMQQMQRIMQNLRDKQPAAFAGISVQYQIDYLSSVRTEQGRVSRVEIPSSNVLEYGLENGDTVIIRPSGTEPKIKIYCSLSADTRALAQRQADLYASHYSELLKA